MLGPCEEPDAKRVDTLSTVTPMPLITPESMVADIVAAAQQKYDAACTVEDELIASMQTHKKLKKKAEDNRKECEAQLKIHNAVANTKITGIKDMIKKLTESSRKNYVDAASHGKQMDAVKERIAEQRKVCAATGADLKKTEAWAKKAADDAAVRAVTSQLAEGSDEASVDCKVKQMFEELDRTGCGSVRQRDFVVIITENPEVAEFCSTTDHNLRKDFYTGNSGSMNGYVLNLCGLF